LSTDAIVMLREDHKEIRRLFRDVRALGPDATASKARLAQQILEALTVHTYIENEIMYPRMRKLVPDVDAEILESYEEHHVADVLATELGAMPPEADHFDAKLKVLMENVEHHIEEEEGSWFPTVREALGRNALQEIGQEMLEAREHAPRRPAQPGALKKAVHALLG
jgi:hemerythrin-like domain-containing protein